MKQEDISALLGRSLTDVEVANFDTYLRVATQTLEELLCMSLSCDSEDRTYDGRVGYRTLFTDIFTDVDSVTIDGETVEESKYTKYQWEKRNGKWFNSLVFSEVMDCEEVTISADWGFRKMPSDLQLLLARAFDLITRQNKLDRTINSKKVEDFTISYNHSSITMSETLMETFARENSATIPRYSLCAVGTVRHGKVNC